MTEVLTTARLRAGLLVPAALAVVVAWVVLALTRDHRSATSFAVMWVAMTIAMMLPTVTRPMMRAAEGSVSRAWLFLLGYGVVWLAAGVPAYALMNAIQWTPFWIALAWIAAGTYQVTPLMFGYLRSCSSIGYAGTPTAYGAKQGIRCVASCAPVMLAAMVTAMALPGLLAPVLLLAALTALICWEKHPSAPRQAVLALGMGMVVLAVVGIMAFGGGAGHLH